MTNANDVNESIINKIKGLYAKAASTDSMEEAETATKLATNLLLKYNLDLNKIDFRTEAEKKPSVSEEYHDLVGEQKRHESEWVAKLYGIIAKYNLCRAFSGGERNSGVDYKPGYVLIIGEPHNIEIVKFIVAQVNEKIRQVEALAWKSYRGSEKRNAFRRGFFQGAVLGIGTKLYHERVAMEVKAREAAGQAEVKEMGLMIVTKDALVNTYIQQNIKFGKPRTQRNLSSQDAKEMGYAAGQNITINKGIKGNANKGFIN